MITLYKTDDGEIFDSLEDAKEHEESEKEYQKKCQLRKNKLDEITRDYEELMSKIEEYESDYGIKIGCSSAFKFPWSLFI